MKTAIILTAFVILCIFAIAIFYPMYRKRREQKKLQAWRKGLKKWDTAQYHYWFVCQLQTTPDVNGDCKVLTPMGNRLYPNVNDLYPLEGGENGKGS